MKQDEIKLLEAMKGRGKSLHPSALEIAQHLEIPYKRAKYIFLKWSGKNWYEYGVSWRVGWMTEAGLKNDPI